MNRNPLVSVLLPAYNHEKYVAASIESIIEQSYPNIELLICDDSSPDGTAEVVRSFAARYPDRIKVHLGRKNRGVASRFNLLCSMASGDYIAPFASDDKLPLDAIEKRIDFLESNQNVDVLVTDMSVIDCNEQIVSKAQQRKLVFQFNRLYEVDFDNLYESLLFGNFIPAGTLCFRMERIQKQELMHDEYCPDLHDYDVWLKLSHKYRWAYLDHSTYLYRWHGDNLSSPHNRSIENLSKIVAQTTYILSKQLLYKQTGKQRKVTLNHITGNCKALFDVLPQQNGKAFQNHPVAPVAVDTDNQTAEPVPGTTTNHNSHGNNDDADVSAGALLQKGKKMFTAGRLKHACDTFIQVLDIEPVNLDAVMHLGMIALHAGNKKQARFFFNQAVEIDPQCKPRLDQIIDRIERVGLEPAGLQEIQAGSSLRN